MERDVRLCRRRFSQADFWDTVIRVAGSLMLATLGCLIASRAGVVYVGVEVRC